MKLTSDELKKIVADYEYNPDIMSEDEPDVRMYKWALSKLPEGDRIIFILYADMESSRKVGALLGVSHNTILKEVNKIRKKIFEICQSI